MSIEDIIQRRMANTEAAGCPETYEVAKSRIEFMMQKADEDAQAAPPNWEADWLRAPPEPASPQNVEFIRTCPPIVQQAMCRFPQGCLVRAVVPLGTPGPGTLAIVRGWLECGDGRIEIQVLAHPRSELVVSCAQHEIEPVHYWAGWTPQRMEEIIRGD